MDEDVVHGQLLRMPVAPASEVCAVARGLP
jgi:hypothetical protein